MISNAIMWLLPSEAVPQVAALLIVLCGFALMLRLVRAAVWLMGFAVLLLAFEPIIEPVVDALIDSALDHGIAWAEQLPAWILIIAAFLLLLIVLRAALSLFLGRRAADHAVGVLAAAGIIGLIRIAIRAPIRLIAVLFGQRHR